ncbi:meiotic recombination protein DMC1, putative, partial [Plasmodium reichenowi]
SDKGVIDATD